MPQPQMQYNPETRRYERVGATSAAEPAPAPAPRSLRGLLGLPEQDAPPEPVADDGSWRDWAAMGVRGLSGLVPGGPWGAAAGGIGEGLAQLLEGRDDMNFAQIATQAGLGFIPFGNKLKGVGQAVVRGGAHGALGAGATHVAETGLPTSKDEFEDLAASTALGGVVGGTAGGSVKKLGQLLGGRRAASEAAGGGRYSAGVRTAQGEPRGTFEPRPGSSPKSVAVKPGEGTTSGRVPYRANTADVVPDEGLPQSTYVADEPGTAIGVRDRGPATFEPTYPEYRDQFPEGRPIGLVDRGPDLFDESQPRTMFGDLGELLGVPATPRPRLTAEETAGMLKGREKFADSVGLDYGTGGMSPGFYDELDRMGVEYNRTQRELKRLLGLPDADPREVERMRQGARELGSRLRKGARLPSISGGEPVQAAAPPALSPVSTARVPDEILPPEQTALAHRVDPLNAVEVVDEIPHAQVRPSASEFNDLAAMLGMRLDEIPTGKRVSNFLADEAGEATLDPQFAIASGALGGGAGYVFSPEDHKGLGTAAGVAAGLGGYGAARRPDLWEQYTTAAMLSSPKTFAKIITGNIGGPLIKAGQRAFADQDPAIIGQTARELFSPDTVDAFTRKFQDSTDAAGDIERLGSGYATSGPASWPGRIIGSLDYATKDAMGRAGFSPEDAAKVTLTAEPENALLRQMLSIQRENRAARIPFPFFKTQAGQFEQGLLEPFQAGQRIFGGEGSREDVAKLATMLGVGAGGYAAADYLPFWAEPFATAAFGPYAAPAAIGAAMTHVPEGSSAAQKLVQLTRSVSQQLPLAEETDYDPRQVIARTVPNVARDAAVLMDDEERQTNQGLFDAAIAKIPFLREYLKPKKAKTRD